MTKKKVVKGDTMVDFIKAHYSKLVAFVLGWLAEAQVQLSAYLKSLLAAIGQ